MTPFSVACFAKKKWFRYDPQFGFSIGLACVRRGTLPSESPVMPSTTNCDVDRAVEACDLRSIKWKGADVCR